MSFKFSSFVYVSSLLYGLVIFVYPSRFTVSLVYGYPPDTLKSTVMLEVVSITTFTVFMYTKPFVLDIFPLGIHPVVEA